MISDRKDLITHPVHPPANAKSFNLVNEIVFLQVLFKHTEQWGFQAHHAISLSTSSEARWELAHKILKTTNWEQLSVG